MRCLLILKGETIMKKSIAILSCICMLVACVVSASATEKPAGWKEVTLKVVLNVEATVDLENNPLFAKLYEDTGIRLDIEAPPQNSYWDRTRIIVASGEYPDLMLQGADVDMDKWASEGLLAELDGLIGSYPNLTANISPQQWEDCRAPSTGKIVAVPRPNSYDYWGYVINQTWLDKLGLKAPTTLDEFVEVCRAFTFNDPDGNGKDDTFGATFSVTNDSTNKLFGLPLEFVSTAFGLSMHDGCPREDGMIGCSNTAPTYEAYLSFMRSLYAEGIIDRDFLTHKANEHLEKFAQNRVGIIGTSGKGYISQLVETYGMDISTFTYHAPLKRTAESPALYMMPPSNWCAYHIFADGQVAEALRFLDYCNSEAGFTMFQVGLKGVHYNSYDIETRVIDRTPEQLELLKTVTSGWLEFANAYLQKAPISGGTTPEQVDKWQKETKAAADVTDYYYVPFLKQYNTMRNALPDEFSMITALQSRYVSGLIEWPEVQDYITKDLAPKVAPYEAEFNAFLVDHPINIVKAVQ
jgi:putative aldouronate transport system substrate-binding protein